MKKRENEALERYKSLHENRLRLAQEEMRKINESAEARQSFINNYHAIRERKALKEVQRSKLMEAARNDALATVIKAIYITALEAESLMDENILLAENMVDKWIEEEGGASKILAKTGNNTYLLSRITQIVEEAAEDAVKEIEEPEEEEPKTDEVPDENASKAVQIAQLTAKDAEIKAQIANLKAEKKAEDEEEKAEEEAEKDAEATADEDSKEDKDGKETSDTPDEEVPAEDGESEGAPDEAEEEVDADMEIEDVPAEDSENTEELPKEDEEKSDEKSEDAPTEDEGEESTESKESEDAPEEAEGEEGSNEEDDIDPDADINMNDDEKELTDGDEVDPDEDASEDDDVEDALGEPIDGDNSSDTDITVDGDTENKGKIFDDLENEDDVQKAIELIRTRVADAEETFIRNNAEDKKKIDELLNKISTNVKTVETMAEKDPKKAQVATEAVRECKRKINDVYKEKSFTVFGKMASILTENIVKDDAIRESYTTEDGTLDVDLAVESAKVMYGFLETLNTIQIEKVDEKYIANIINGMK